jgi:hypothetical protein
MRLPDHGSDRRRAYRYATRKDIRIGVPDEAYRVGEALSFNLVMNDLIG